MAALHIIHVIARIKRRIAVVVNRDVGLAGVIRRGYSPPLFGMNCSRTDEFVTVRVNQVIDIQQSADNIQHVMLMLRGTQFPCKLHGLFARLLGFMNDHFRFLQRQLRKRLQSIGDFFPGSNLREPQRQHHRQHNHQYGEEYFERLMRRATTHFRFLSMRYASITV